MKNKIFNRKKLIIIAITLFTLIWTSVSVQSYDSTAHPFELDGNAIDTDITTTPPDDWESLWQYYYVDPIYPVSSSIYTLVNDSPLLTGGDTSHFKKGSSSGDYIYEWTWDPGDTTPGKSEIIYAYTAGYIDDGDFLIYFGADRQVNTGTCYMGFWFFQNEVGLNTDGSGTFYGEHTDGDVLVVVDYNNGGGVQEVNVWAWNSSAPDHFDDVFTSPSADCALCDHCLVCAIVNQEVTPAPWPYWSSMSSWIPGTFPDYTFVEGVINITAFIDLGLLPEGICISTFMADTRSSSSVTAELKDFALGDFTLDSIDIDKTCDTTVAHVNDWVTYTFNITNTGIQTLILNNVEDDVIGPLNSYIESTPGEILDPGEYYEFDVDFQILGSHDDPLNNTVTANYTSECGFVEATDNYEIDIIHPDIDIQKTPDYQEKYVGDTVTFNIRVENTGDVTLTNVVVTDAVCPDCDHSIGTLTVGQVVTYQCTMTAPYDDFTNVAIVTGDDPLGEQVTDNDDADVHILCLEPVITTLLSETTITLGDSITDTATFYGLDGYTPQNNIVFEHKGPSATSWTTLSSNALTLVSAGVWEATSDSFEPDELGTWYFRATYAADDYYCANASEDDAEPLIVEGGGCSFTPGYWKTHSSYGPAGPADPTWMELPDMDGNSSTEGPDEIFYDNDYNLTWLTVMTFSSKDAKSLGLNWNTVQVYQHLAFHYVAAYLNELNNGFIPSDISENLSNAEYIFNTYKNMKIPIGSNDEALAKNISSTLGWFNEGCYPGWIHCDLEFGSITIKIYNDKNGNSTFDGDDEYIAEGWNITRNDGPCECNPDVNMTTDSNGQVYFADVRPGTYLITIDVPAGWTGPTEKLVSVGSGEEVVVEIPYQQIV